MAGGADVFVATGASAGGEGGLGIKQRKIV